MEDVLSEKYKKEEIERVMETKVSRGLAMRAYVHKMKLKRYIFIIISVFYNVLSEVLFIG